MADVMSFKSPVPRTGLFVDISRERNLSSHREKIADQLIGPAVPGLRGRNFSGPFLLGYALHTAAGAVVLLTIRVAA